MLCRCRHCFIAYEDDTVNTEVKGYCSEACMIQKAQSFGWGRISNFPMSQRASMAQVLIENGEAGNRELRVRETRIDATSLSVQYLHHLPDGTKFRMSDTQATFRGPYDFKKVFTKGDPDIDWIPGTCQIVIVEE